MAHTHTSAMTNAKIGPVLEDFCISPTLRIRAARLSPYVPTVPQFSEYRIGMFRRHILADYYKSNRS